MFHAYCERVSRERLPVDRLPSRCSMVSAPARGGAPRRTPSEVGSAAILATDAVRQRALPRQLRPPSRCGAYRFAQCSI